MECWLLIKGWLCARQVSSLLYYFSDIPFLLSLLSLTLTYFEGQGQNRVCKAAK